MKKALITGITGQDGSYLAELLLEKGYGVLGIMRRSSSFNTTRINHLYKNKNFNTRYGDLLDPISIANLIDEFKPDEIYNLGAMSHVRISFDMPRFTLETNALGPVGILEYIRKHAPRTKFYQASSSEMFGATKSKPPFNLDSKFHPQSPYGVSKVAAFHLTRIYREGYGLFAANGILFNHESERRGETFVTRKITRGIARIKAGLDKKLYLGRSDDLKRRIVEHENGKVDATKNRLPIELIFYEAFKNKSDAIRRENYFKTTKGKRALAIMLKESLR